MGNSEVHSDQDDDATIIYLVSEYGVLITPVVKKESNTDVRVLEGSSWCNFARLGQVMIRPEIT